MLLGIASFLDEPTRVEIMIEIEFASEMSQAQAVCPLSQSRVLAFNDGHIGVFEGDFYSAISSVGMPVETSGGRNHHNLTPRLHLSPSNRFAALVNDYGQFGAVFDLQEKRQTMSLNRGDYHPETQPFPLTFFSYKERDLVVYASDWNRLEISDPLTGELLTRRAAIKHEDRNPHYLDYFHGTLRVSPDCKWIVDDGWVWQPFGIVALWSLERWLDNPYESEDGNSKRTFAFRDEWDKPFCWINSASFAVEGIGPEDELIHGATIYDLKGEQISQFAGPSGSFWSDGTRLFSVEDDGLHFWNVERGARTGFLKDFRPQFQFKNALTQNMGNTMTIWNYE